MFKFSRTTRTSLRVQFKGSRSLKGFDLVVGLVNSHGKFTPHAALICGGVVHIWSSRRYPVAGGQSTPRYTRFLSDLAYPRW